MLTPMHEITARFRAVEEVVRRKGITDRDRYARHVMAIVEEVLQGRTHRDREWKTVIEWAIYLLGTDHDELIQELRSTK